MGAAEFWALTPRLFFKMLHRRRLARYRDSYQMGLLISTIMNAFPSGRGIRGYEPNDFIVDVPYSIRSRGRERKRAEVAGMAQAALITSDRLNREGSDGTDSR
jgi:hypothetical protein